MNQEFVQHALSNGEKGSEWLKRIPHIIKESEEKWSVRVGPPFNLSYNYVAPAEREDGSQAVLKIGFPLDREFQTEIDALKVFNGEGIERIYEEDKENSAILIERVTPGVPLSDIGDDEEGTRILARVMKKIWKPLPADNKFITVREWMRELPAYMEKHKGSGPLPWYLVVKANTLFEELLSTSEPAVLVHGDLHHDNVLSSIRDDWLAIDPKGIAAEPAYETAAMIRNPYGTMKDRSNLEDILLERIILLSEELELDPNRIQKWCLAQTVLSAVWNDAGVKGSQHSVRIAETLDSIKI